MFRVLIILLVLVVEIFGQRYLVHPYVERKKGLASSMVFDIEQDDFGRIWFATRAGVSIYAGWKWYNPEIWKMGENEPQPQVIKLYKDEKSVIWAVVGRNHEEIGYFNGFEYVKYSDIPKINGYVAIHSLAVSKTPNGESKIYLATNYGILANIKKKWKVFNTNDGLISDSVYSIMYKDGKVVFATPKGIGTLDDKGFNYSLNNLLPKDKKFIWGLNEDNSLSEKGTGKIWLVGKDWLGYIKNNRLTYVSSFTSSLLVTNNPISISSDNLNGIVFGNPAVVFHYSAAKKDVRTLTHANGLLTEGANTVFNDREGNLWIGTNRGVSKIISLKFETYRTFEGFDDNEVTCIYEIAKDKILFTHATGMSIFENGKLSKKISLSSNNLPRTNARVLDIAKDKAGNLWLAATNAGLLCYTNSGILKRYKVLDDSLEAVWSVFNDKDKRLIIGATTGLYEMKDGAIKLISNEYLYTHIRRIERIDDSTLFYSTSNKGLLRERNGVIKKLTYNDKILNVYDAHYENEDSIIIAAIDGIYLLKHGKVQKINLHNLKVNTPVYVIKKDSFGNLWFGTEKGIIFNNNKDVEWFRALDGIAGNEVNRNALIEDSQKRIWIGTITGASLYYPLDFKYFQKIHITPNIAIDSVILADKSVLREFGDITLGYDENKFEVYFTEVSFYSERLNTIEWKLEGMDTEWQSDRSGGTNPIIYSYIPPGEYRFMLRMINYKGDTSKVITSGIITIRNHFYLQWWFILLSVVLTIALVYWGHNYLSQKKINQNLEKEVELKTNQLFESEELNRQIFETNRACMILIEPKTLVIIEANPSALLFYNIELEQFVGRSFWDFHKYEGDIDFTAEKIYLEKRSEDESKMYLEIFPCPLKYYEREVLFLIIYNITERVLAEDKIKAALKEKEVLLKEINHRVKNNMQIVSSLLSLQSQKLENAELKGLFIESQSRIRALALVHEKLYQSEDLAQIKVKDYFDGLVQPLVKTFRRGASNVNLMLDLDDSLIPVDTIIPLGLIVNELVTNSLKYAFPDGRAGTITFSFKSDKSGKKLLEYSDDGVGVPKDFNYEKVTSLGLKLIQSLTKQVNGSLTIEREIGIKYKIEL